MLNNGNNPTETSMAKHDIIDDIIEQLDPEAIPPEYIIMAKIETHSGGEATLTGEELVVFLNLYSDSISNIKLILDIKKIKKDVNAATDAILDMARFD